MPWDTSIFSHASLRGLLGRGMINQRSQSLSEICERPLRRGTPGCHESCPVETRRPCLRPIELGERKLYLTPIEHVWYRLKRLVYEVRPHIEQVEGDADSDREALWDALKRVWHLVEESEELVESMPHKVAGAIRADGWYTKY